MQLKELKPADLDYERVLGGLFNGDAAATQPAAIVQPLNEEQVVAAVVRAREEGLRLRVCSGGHSRFCSGDGALMLDLAAHFRDVSVRGDVVTVQGGTGMGTVLQALAPHGRMLPVGTHPTPGFGLLTMGGLGHLSRRFGLTLDQISGGQDWLRFGSKASASLANGRVHEVPDILQAEIELRK